jgi:hypothetical protein
MSITPHRWYTSASWVRRAKHQLRIEPLCRFCLEAGRVTAATIADHVEPHKGDINRFRLGKLQSLCQHCHVSRKHEIEIRGYATDIGLDGMPTDPRHPVYR